MNFIYILCLFVSIFMKAQAEKDLDNNGLETMWPILNGLWLTLITTELIPYNWTQDNRPESNQIEEHQMNEIDIG